MKDNQKYGGADRRESLLQGPMHVNKPIQHLSFLDRFD